MILEFFKINIHITSNKTGKPSLRFVIWGVLEKGYPRDARTDFDAKYVKRRGSAQGSAFWGRETNI